MEFLNQLWMPILISAVAVWFVSFLTHMVIPIHKGEFKGLPDEKKVEEALTAVPSGSYMIPWCEMADWKSPEMQERMKRGPNGTIVIWPGAMNFGQNLVLTLLYYVLVGVFVAYVGWHGLGADVSYLTVFRVCGAAAFMAHGLGPIPRMIWYKDPGLVAYIVDGLLYALVTAGIFGWLWPKIAGG